MAIDAKYSVSFLVLGETIQQRQMETDSTSNVETTAQQSTAHKKADLFAIIINYGKKIG